MKPELHNLITLGTLAAEPYDASEAQRMLIKADIDLADARNTTISEQARFNSAYSAAHMAAIVGLRLQGLRNKNNRYIAFQCLQHTVGWPASKWRIFDAAHARRNRAEYEAYIDHDPKSTAELVELADELIKDVKRRVP